MEKMKMFYIANARMPTEKAHGIQIAKTCEAFIKKGIDLTLIVGSRGASLPLKDAFALSVDIPLLRLPVPDFQRLGPVGYRMSALIFVLEYLLFLFVRVCRGEKFLLYTVDMDNFSFVPLVLVPRPLFCEMHGIKKSSFFLNFFFKRAFVITINKLIADKTILSFSIPPKRVLVEPNGVDGELFQKKLVRSHSRARLGLPAQETVVLYVGQFYEWKGLDILAQAASRLKVRWQIVGGEREEYENITSQDGSRLQFAGMRPIGEIPLWVAAADVLLILGTAQNDSSYRYTAPMKVYEYLATGRPVVASATPALKSLLPEDSVVWYEPDNPASLADAVRTALSSRCSAERRIALAAEHTWEKRAERILAFIKTAANLPR